MNTIKFIFLLMIFPVLAQCQTLNIPANSTHTFTTSNIQLDELIVGTNAILSFQTDAREVVIKCKYLKIGEGAMINGRGQSGQRGETPPNGDAGSDCSSGERGGRGSAGEKGGNGLSLRIETQSFSFDPFVVDVSGGNGGRGGNGSNGGRGGNATCECSGRNGGHGGSAGNGGNGGSAGSFSVFAEKLDFPTQRTQKINLILMGGKGGTEGSTGRGGQGGRSKNCSGKTKEGGSSGESGDWGTAGGQGLSRTQHTWLYENLKGEDLVKSGNAVCACIKALNYKAGNKRVLNNNVLSCFDQNVANLQTTLSAAATNPAEVSKEAIQIYMLNNCPTEYESLAVEEENRQLTLPSSGDIVEKAVTATCQCIAKGSSLATCQKAMVDLNEEKIKQHFGVANIGAAQSDFLLNITFKLLDVCDAAKSDSDLRTLKSLSPVTGNCATTLSGSFISGDGKTILFDKESYSVKSGKIKEEYSLQWNDCIAKLTCVKTNSDKNKKGDKHSLTILRASENGFMGIYETPSGKELMQYKARPRIANNELIYLGQRFSIGQRVYVDSTNIDRSIPYIKYFDPVKIEMVTILTEAKVAGTITDITYNKKLDLYWITVKPTGEMAKLYRKFFIDVEGLIAKGDLKIE